MTGHLRALPPHRIVEYEPSPARGIGIGMAVGTAVWCLAYAVVRRVLR